MSNDAPDTAPESAWLKSFVTAHGGVAGTVHRRSGPDELALSSAVNIPEPVQRIVAIVPRGKGMAGLAFDGNKPIASCNIQSDSSGQVRPGAKAVGAQGGVALPVHDDAGQVRAIVGIAFMQERDFSDDELAALTSAAASLP